MSSSSSARHSACEDHLKIIRTSVHCPTDWKRYIYHMCYDAAHLLQDGGALLVDSFLLLSLRHRQLHRHLSLLPFIHVKELSDCLLRNKVEMRHQAVKWLSVLKKEALELLNDTLIVSFIKCIN